MKKWRISDIIDMEYFFHKDAVSQSAEDQQYLNERDRNIFLNNIKPTIKEGETITVEPIAPEAVKKGDIILYRTPGGVVAHRVVGIERKTSAHHLFLLRGDAATTCDAPVAPDQVLGKVISVMRDGRNINPYCLKVKTQRLARLIASRIKRWLLRLAEGQRHIDELTL